MKYQVSLSKKQLADLAAVEDKTRQWEAFSDPATFDSANELIEAIANDPTPDNLRRYADHRALAEARREVIAMAGAYGRIRPAEVALHRIREIVGDSILRGIEALRVDLLDAEAADAAEGAKYGVAASASPRTISLKNLIGRLEDTQARLDADSRICPVQLAKTLGHDLPLTSK